MAYTKQTWIAPAGTGLNRYAKGAETSTHIELNLDPTSLTNTPTPITVARLNHMEDGIAEADKAQNLAPDAILHYSFDEIKQIPDDPAGTTYKRDNDWTTTDGWTAINCSISVIDGKLKNNNATNINQYIQKTFSTIAVGAKIIIKIKRLTGVATTMAVSGGVSGNTEFPFNSKGEVTAVFTTIATTTNIIIYGTFGLRSITDLWEITSIYIGNGSYLNPVIDHSYSLAHAENHGVIPVNGVCGKAGYFNNSYMISPRPSLADDITVYFWAKFDALGSQTIVQSRTIAGEGLSVLQLDNSYRLDWRGNQAWFTGYTPPINTWHHVTVKCNATTKVLKINGETKVTLSGTYGLTENLAPVIWSGMIGTGGIPSGSPLTGSLDGLQIIPRFTTDDEDTANYKARAWLPKFYTESELSSIITLRRSVNFTLPIYLDWQKLRIANTHATNTITVTMPSGYTMNGQSSFTIAPNTLLEFELIGTKWVCVSNEWELLWTNPSNSLSEGSYPLSGFIAQFKHYCVTFKMFSSEAQVGSSIAPTTTLTMKLSLVDSRCYHRTFVMSNTSFVVSTGYIVTSYGATDSPDNSVIVPLYVYGKK